MREQIEGALRRSPVTLVSDAIGAASLMVMLLVALHLPAML